MFAPKANSKQKCMNATQEHEKGPLLQGYSPWRDGGEQTLLSITQSLAVASGWRANTALCHV